MSELGELVSYVLTGGEAADISHARGLLRRRRIPIVGDRAYDRDALVAHIEGLATRYEKTARSYLGVVATSAWLVALTGWGR